MRRLKLIIFLCFVCSSLAFGAGLSASFTRVESGDMVFSMLQDERGMVWAGTQYGLSSFNGVTFSHKQFYLPQPAPRDMRVNCFLHQSDQRYFVGTSCGLFSLDIGTMQAEKLSCLENLDVRAVCNTGDGKCLICSSTGLFLYDKSSCTLSETGITAMCYGAVSLSQDTVLICSYQGAYSFDCTSCSVEKLTGIPVRSDGILSAVKDEERHCVWIGTNGSLYQYDIRSRACTVVSLPSNTYKTLLLDSTGLLLCGTENGLLVYDPDSGQYGIQRHKAKDYSTLTGNVVWSLMEDDCKNIWVGTNKGVSVWQRNSPVTILDWDVLTGSEEENNLFCIGRDREGRLWTGGDAGATVFSAPDAGNLLCWYRIDNPEHHLNKNTVRRITLDDDGDLWIATDEGIDMLDTSTGEFRNFVVYDESGMSSANWVYDIVDDHRGNLWIASFESGVFIVDKSAIKASSSRQFRTERTLSSANGAIANNTVGRIVPGEDDKMWILLTSLGLLSYDLNDCSTRLFSPEFFASADPLRNLFVNGSQVWVGTLGGLYCLDTNTLQYRCLPMPKMAYANPFALRDGVLWVIDGEILVSVDPESFETKELLLGHGGFSDGVLWGDGRIVLGGKGQLAVVSASIQEAEPEKARVYLTDFRFNGIPADVGGNPDYVDELTVPFGKDLEIDVSTGFFRSGFNNVEYSVRGMCSWTRMNKSFQSINFAGLRPGRHILQFRSVDDGTIIKQVEIRALSAWYLRWYMFLLYVAVIGLAIGLVRALSKMKAYLEKKQTQLDNIRQMTEADRNVESSDKIFIERLNSYIEENLSREDLNVNEIAEYLRVPPKQLYRKVKSIYGFTVVQYVRNYRLQKAASLLKTGGLSISEVMYRVGFSNLSYFTKCFKEMFGMGPKSYLEK